MPPISFEPLLEADPYEWPGPLRAAEPPTLSRYQSAPLQTPGRPLLSMPIPATPATGEVPLARRASYGASGLCTDLRPTHQPASEPDGIPHVLKGDAQPMLRRTSTTPAPSSSSSSLLGGLSPERAEATHDAQPSSAAGASSVSGAAGGQHAVGQLAMTALTRPRPPSSRRSAANASKSWWPSRYSGGSKKAGDSPAPSPSLGSAPTQSEQAPPQYDESDDYF